MGTISGIFTVTAILVILAKLQYKFVTYYAHNVIGIIFMVFCILLVISGFLNLAMRKLVNMDWNTLNMLNFQKVHKYFGYSMILLVQIPVITGLSRRMEEAN